MSRILLLGATGFIGRRVAIALREAGHAPVIARRGTPPADIDPDRTVSCDLLRPDSLRTALEGVTMVVNCAGGDGRTLSDGVAALCAAARTSGSVTRIVHLSSLAVYGGADRLVDEDSAVAGSGWYEQAKIAAERALQSFAGAGRDGVILRPGIVYGPEGAQWTRRVAQWLRHGRVGDLGAAGDGRCHLVHVDDVARAVAAAVSLAPRDAARVVNLPGGDDWTWNRYFRRFSLALDLPRLRAIGPRRLALETRVLALPLRAGAMAIGRARAARWDWPEAIPPSALRLFGQRLLVDDHRARALLGLRWTPAHEGVPAVARALRDAHGGDAS